MYNILNLQHIITFHGPYSTFPQYGLPLYFFDGVKMPNARHIHIFL
jgi:hypothetical protein